MPVKAVRRHHTSSPKHKHTQNYLQAYWPYLPMIFILGIGLLLGGQRPIGKGGKGVLSFATEISSSALLSGTNSQRAGNGQASLKLNQQLASAAQAKADDMVARNYWSHTTPDGQQPWVFISNAGYKYAKAGENLAYGFATSTDTVIGWINSPTHKANLLDPDFSEVGFGITNGSDYNQSGPETVVVAMYGQPQVLSDTSQKTIATTQPKKATPLSTTQPAEVVKPEPAPVDATAKQTLTTEEPTPSVEVSSTEITRAQIITKGKTPWIVSTVAMLSGLCAILLLARHGAGFHRLIRSSENFILKHPVIDMILVTIIMLGYVLSSTTGFIQ